MRGYSYAFITIFYILINSILGLDAVMNNTVSIPTTEGLTVKKGITLVAMTLVGPNATEVWDPNNTDGTNQLSGTDQKLNIKMAILGPEAKAGELNVLQVEAMGLKGPIKTPIALLELGKTAQTILDLSFPDPPVTFTLINGSGPVHIVGHNLLGTTVAP